MSKKIVIKIHNYIIKLSPLFRRLSWQLIQQKKELLFHKNVGGDWRKTDSFTKQNNAMFKRWGFESNQYQKQYILDLGCGSRLRSTYFVNANIFGVEPLGAKYLKLKFCDFDKAQNIYFKPAEHMIKELKEQIDLLLCINVLDHAINPELVLQNCYNYLKKDGHLILSVDCHFGDITPTHPWGFTKEEILALLTKSNFVVLKIFEEQGFQNIKEKTYTFKAEKIST